MKNQTAFLSVIALTACAAGAVATAAMAAPARGGTGQPVAAEPMIWLEPFSYMQMREMREQMKKRAAARQTRAAGKAGDTGKTKSGKARTGRPASGRPSGGYSTRIIHLRHGAYPPEDTGGKWRKSAIRSPAAHSPQDIMWLEKPDMEVLAIDPRQRRNTTTGNYKTAYGGDYRIVAYRDDGVKGRRRTQLFSFYEFMAHGDKPPFKRNSDVARAGYYNGKPEFEISRIYGQHSERYRSRTGHRARLKVSYRGKPLAGKPVTLSTGQGWRQTRHTNGDGVVQFTLIKEDFPQDGTDKRSSSLYLARVSHLAAEKGKTDGAPYEEALYVATMSIRVSPSALDWESRSMAYVVSFFTLGFAGFAIAIRRRRRPRKSGGNGK